MTRTAALFAIAAAAGLIAQNETITQHERDYTRINGAAEQHGKAFPLVGARELSIWGGLPNVFAKL